MILTNGQLVFVIIVIAFLVYAFLNAVLQTIAKISTNKVYRIIMLKMVDDINPQEAYAIISAYGRKNIKTNKENSESK